MIEWLIIIGFILLLLSIFFVMPVLGLGMVIPGVGDLLDLPLAAVTGLLGLFFITLGLGWWFIEYLIKEFWWLLLIAAIPIVLLVLAKVGYLKGKRRVRR